MSALIRMAGGVLAGVGRAATLKGSRADRAVARTIAEKGLRAAPGGSPNSVATFKSAKAAIEQRRGAKRIGKVGVTLGAGLASYQGWTAEKRSAAARKAAQTRQDRK